MKPYRLGLVLLGLVTAAGMATAGTRTSAFAPVDPGVRAAALGGANSALGGEPTALYWNPATLFFQRGRSLEASYTDLYNLGLAKRTFVTVGIKSEIEQPRFLNDRVVVRRDTETGPAYAVGIQSLFLDIEENGYSELSLGGGAAWGYGDHLALGVALRALFISSDLTDVGAYGYNLGMGLAVQYSENERLGVSIPHLLSRVFWDFDSTERLPMSLSLGWTRSFDMGLLVTTETEWREGERGPYRLAAGGEWWAVRDRLAIRSGFRHLSGNLGDLNKPTFGAGVRFNRLRIDYAFRLGPEALGDTHRVGIVVGL